MAPHLFLQCFAEWRRKKDSFAEDLFFKFILYSDYFCPNCPQNCQ
jgi:hypothetical protein